VRLTSDWQMENHSLKASIITVCLNADKYIEQAILSVLGQTYENIEYIIVDGKSTDRTPEIINKYKNRINRVIAEKDHGLYDAMNKGVIKATGDIIYFLNADDRFCDDRVVEDVAREFRGNNALGLILGKVQLVNAPEGFVMPQKNSWRTIFSRKRDVILFQICHQRMFCRKILFDKVGFFNLRYRILADYDWFLKAVYQQSIPIKYLERDVAFYNILGKSHAEGMAALHEKLEVILKNSLWDFIVYAWDKLWAMGFVFLKRQ